MRLRKRLPLLLVILLFGCNMGMMALAHEVPDISRKGSISVKMEYDGKAVAGGTLSIYQVGEIKEDNGNYSFVPTGNFSDCGADLEDIGAYGLADSLAKYVYENELTGKVQTISNDGTTLFSDLEAGLYLIVQTKAADSYEAVSPFLISVPMCEDGNYIYDVDAAPKLESLKKVDPTIQKPVPPNSTTPKDTTPKGTTQKKLPQTGQLNWPVPVMAVSGLCLFLAGWVIRFGKKGDAYGT